MIAERLKEVTSEKLTARPRKDGGSSTLFYFHACGALDLPSFTGNWLTGSFNI